MFVMKNQLQLCDTWLFVSFYLLSWWQTALCVQCRIKSACVAYHMVIKSVFYFNLDLFCNVHI